MDKAPDGYVEMKCDNCWKEWIAICYFSSKELECPKCHKMVKVGEL